MICLEPNCQGDRPCAACSDKMLAPVFQGIRAAFLTKAQAEIFLISYNAVKLNMRRQAEAELEQLIANVMPVASAAPAAATVTAPQQESLTPAWSAKEVEGVTGGAPEAIPSEVSMTLPVPPEPEPGAGEPALSDVAMAAVKVALAMERGESPPPRPAPAPVPVVEVSAPASIPEAIAPDAVTVPTAPISAPTLAAKPEAPTPGEEIEAALDTAALDPALLTNGAAHKEASQPKGGKRRIVSTP